MKRNRKRRSEASNAVIALRTALGLTQQRFAVEVVKTAIVTATRWENSHPPHGDTLLKLAEVARQNNQHAFALDFELLYLREILPRLEKRIKNPGPDSGYVICRYNTAKETPEAAEFLINSALDVAPDQAREYILDLARQIANEEQR